MSKLAVYCLLFAALVPLFAYTHMLARAAEETEYTLLQPIPLEDVDGDDTETTTASDYIKGMFTLIIAVAGGLAVVKLIFGGIKYMSTDAFSGKSEAKDIIQNAVWGLLLVISAWLILYTVNPDLIKLDLSIPEYEI